MLILFFYSYNFNFKAFATVISPSLNADHNDAIKITNAYSKNSSIIASAKQQYNPILRYSNGSKDILPIINDPNLKVQVVASGLDAPTTMAFLDQDDILVLEKDKGTVQRIVDGKIQPEPLLDVNVASAVERCMCGIAISKTNDHHTFVFLYYTEAAGQDGGPAIGNRLYKYELIDNKLVDPKLLLDLPALPGPRHNGGAIIIGASDNNIYVPIGDIDNHKTQAQNIKNGPPVDGTGGILRVTKDGKPVLGNPLGSQFPQSLYYAYGIRNSFGLDFDPVTGKLWDTENGPGFGDEINLVNPGFNSGWKIVQGIWLRESNNAMGPVAPMPQTSNNDLVNFGGKGVYSPPEFTWNHTVGPTKIKFLNSDKLGKQYENDIFIGDIHQGNLYHFKLNQNRTQLILKGPLGDKVANTDKELDTGGVIFGKGFGGISDLEVGPDDGYLYVASLGEGTAVLQTYLATSSIV